MDRKYTIDNYIKEKKLNREHFWDKNIGFMIVMIILIMSIGIICVIFAPIELINGELEFMELLKYWLIFIILEVIFICGLIPQEIPITDKLRYEHLESYEDYLNELEQKKERLTKLKKAKRGELKWQEK